MAGTTAPARPAVTAYVLFGADGFLGDRIRVAVERGGRASYLVAVGAPWSRAPAGSTCRWRTMDVAHASVAEITELLLAARADVVVNAVGATPDATRRLDWAHLGFAGRLVEAVARVGTGRVIQLGSSAEYGDQPAGGAIAETAAARPVGDFATTKLLATELITSRVERGVIRATVVRVFDAIGPGAPAGSLAGMAHRALRHAIRTRASTVTVGHLAAVRDFVDADDVADAVVRVARGGEVPPVLNLGRGVAMSGRSMVELLAAAAGFDGDVIESGVDALPPAMTAWQQADVSLLRDSLQWVPTTPIAGAVVGLWWPRTRGPAPHGRRPRRPTVSRPSG